MKTSQHLNILLNISELRKGEEDMVLAQLNKKFVMEEEEEEEAVQ